MLLGLPEGMHILQAPNSCLQTLLGKAVGKEIRKWLNCNWDKGLQILFVWRTPGTGEPDGLLSMGLHRVGHK